MKLMMDTISYALFPGIRRDQLGFAEAIYQLRTEFGTTYPTEWRVAWPVMRDLLRAVDERSGQPSVDLTPDGYKIVGVPLMVLPDCDDDTVMAVLKTETLEVPHGA